MTQPTPPTPPTAWRGATEIAPDREVQRLAAAGLVGYRQDRGRLLHCLYHKPAPASRYADFHEVMAEDLPDGGICVHPSCGADLLAVLPIPSHGEAASVGPRCGNNPNARLTDGDRKAIADFKAYLADRAASTPAAPDDAARRTLTPDEYSAAWHAVEGAAGEPGADPGTVLHAVLNRLGIQPPAPSTPPSDDHAAVYLDQDGDPWVEYLTSPRTNQVVPLVMAPEQAVDRAELVGRIGALTLIGWCKGA